MGSEMPTYSSESSNMHHDENKQTNNKNIRKNNLFSVLIVDDDLVAGTIHQTMLAAEGMEVHLATNGLEAVEFHRTGVSFDLILMDLEMPVMNGYKATKELRDMGIHGAIVGVTSGDEDERKIFMNAGLDDCITKPLTISKIALHIPVHSNNNSECGDYINYVDDDDVDDFISSCSSNNNF